MVNFSDFAPGRTLLLRCCAWGRGQKILITKKMIDKSQVTELLRKLSDRPVTLHTVFSKAFGGITNALLFQQIYFWSDKGGRKDGYIYKTKKEIETETTLTPRQQDLARESLKKLGVIETELMKVRGFPILHYKVDLRAVFKVVLEHYNLSLSSISEMTPEKRKKEAISPYGEKHFSSYEKTKRTDERVVRIVQRFKAMGKKRLGIEPAIDVSDEVMVSRALSKYAKSEEEIYTWLEIWFSLNKPESTLIHLRQALSSHQINNYRTFR